MGNDNFDSHVCLICLNAGCASELPPHKSYPVAFTPLFPESLPGKALTEETPMSDSGQDNCSARFSLWEPEASFPAACSGSCRIPG